MKSHARVVVVGGGVMGVGLLYHLALEGWSDIALIEKGELTSGSTWHAAGQCPQFNGSLNMSKVHLYGTQLYPQLEKLTGQAVSWHGCGGLRLATTDEEVNWFKYVYGVSRLAGYECEIIGPGEIKQYHPFLETFGVKAAFRTVTDGHVAPADITNAMAAGARQLGAEIYRRTRVMDIKLLPSGEWNVITDKGNITCQHVVNSAGSYCDVVGSWTGHNVPIANMLHHYMITEPLKELIDLAPELPVVRDPYSHAYLREETNGVLVGPYETATAHLCWDGQPPAWDFESELVAPELDRLTPWLERATERMPIFGNAGLKSIISGAITHTPDGTYLSGPAPGPKNYWMHCGASIGICQGGGAGKYLAQWMVHGQAEINMREFDPRRFGNWASKDYTAEVSVADYHHMYYCYKPGEQHEVGRGLRRSSLYEKLKSEGAQFAQIFGWERPRWYDTTGKGEAYSFKRSNWFDAVRDEALAVREKVGLMDLSTFSKFEVTGPDAYGFLERICANKIPAKDGGIILGHLLNENGFIESEITVTRLGPEHFYVLSAAVAQLHDKDQLEWRRLATEKVTITDVTDDFGVLVLAGPLAREVLSKCTATDLSNTCFRWLTGKEAEVAGVKKVRLLRVNYVGELGWELHVPMADMPKVFDALTKAGKPYGLKLFGTYAMNSLRMEKSYRGWGSELTTEIDMFEASMERFIRLEKPEFIGKAATLSMHQRGARMKLVPLEVANTDSDCVGNEPVYSGDRIVGLTTSGGYGHAVRKSLAFAYVDPKMTGVGTGFDVLMFGEKRKASIIGESPWDPANARLKS
ncbi:MAG: FAD-dependent oxidoreductase [Hyphomicrobiales bacterium]|nr:FAD-dependent oxidoreductase [Hyphomicrobiales bacterium]